MTERSIRLSPINSPTRKKKQQQGEEEERERKEKSFNYSLTHDKNDDENDLQDTDSDESYSIRSPAPSFISDDQTNNNKKFMPSKNSLTHDHNDEITNKSNQAYSNLMNFLDDASANLPQEVNKKMKRKNSQTSPRRDTSTSKVSLEETLPVLDVDVTSGDYQDDLSSMFYSVSRSGTCNGSKAFTSNKYIWNELDEVSDEYHVPTSTAASRRTRSDITFFKVPSSYQDVDDIDGQSKTTSCSSLQSNIKDIEMKVNNMKNELRKKNQRMNELQNELIRIKEIKKRKYNKYYNQYNHELTDIRTNNNESLKKQQHFVDKVQEDVGSLDKKYHDLTMKLDNNKQTLSLKVQKAKEDGVREIKRSRRQWEQDEKTLFEKIYMNKRYYFVVIFLSH